MSGTRFLALVLAASALVATALMAIPIDGAEGTAHTGSIAPAPYRLTAGAAAGGIDRRAGSLDAAAVARQPDGPLSGSAARPRTFAPIDSGFAGSLSDWIEADSALDIHAWSRFLAENRCPPPIKSGVGVFRKMLWGRERACDTRVGNRTVNTTVVR